MRVPFFASLCIGVVAACTFPTDACGCSPVPPASAIVFGIISAADGSPVAGALVNATGARGSCPAGGPSAVSPYGSRPSDSAGRYRLSVGSIMGAEGTACVRLSAKRAQAVGTDSVFAPAVSLVLRNYAYDSIRVDFSLP